MLAAMDAETTEQRARDARERAHKALDRFHLSREAVAELFRLGENDVFRVTDPQQGRFALRIHKPGYQNAASVASELAWLAALASGGVLIAELWRLVA